MCVQITVTKDDTIILDGAGSKDAISERCAQIRQAADETTSDYDRDKLQERLAKLSGGVAVLKIGGASEVRKALTVYMASLRCCWLHMSPSTTLCKHSLSVRCAACVMYLLAVKAAMPSCQLTSAQQTSCLQVEVGEKKDRVTDALNATKAAVDEGIVAGGGAALLHASRSLPSLKEGMPNLDQKVGVDIVSRAVQMPAKTILRNAGLEGAVVVGKLLESENPNFGYDSAKDEYCNMVDAGVLTASVHAMCDYWCTVPCLCTVFCHKRQHPVGVSDRTAGCLQALLIH